MIVITIVIILIIVVSSTSSSSSSSSPLSSSLLRIMIISAITGLDIGHRTRCKAFREESSPGPSGKLSRLRSGWDPLLPRLATTERPWGSWATGQKNAELPEPCPPAAWSHRGEQTRNPLSRAVTGWHLETTWTGRQPGSWWRGPGREWHPEPPIGRRPTGIKCQENECSAWNLNFQVGNWVRFTQYREVISDWDRLEGQDKQKGEHKCRLTLIGAVCAARYAAVVVMAIFASLRMNPVPPNDPKRLCGIASDPVSRSFW